MQYLLESVPSRATNMSEVVRKQKAAEKQRRVRAEIDAATLSLATPYSPAQLRHLRAEFDRCGSWLKEALEQGGELHTLDSLWDLLRNGTSYLWPCSESAGVLTVTDYPLGRMMTVWLAGGKLEQILAEEPKLAAWATENGCTHFQLLGRAGWQKALKALGWEKAGVVLKRRL